MKVLWRDCNGYCLLSKWLHRTLFRLQKDVPRVGAAMQLAELLAGVANKSTERTRELQ